MLHNIKTSIANVKSLKKVKGLVQGRLVFLEAMYRLIYII